MAIRNPDKRQQFGTCDGFCNSDRTLGRNLQRDSHDHGPWRNGQSQERLGDVDGDASRHIATEGHPNGVELQHVGWWQW